MTDPAALSETEARAALDALDGLTWAPFTLEALPEVAAFYAVVEEHDANPERTSLAELVDYVDSPRSVPEEDALLGRNRDGQIIATAWAGCNQPLTEVRSMFLGGAVHPDHRGRGLGRAVLAWELAHGRCWDAATRERGIGPLRLRLMAPTGHADARHLAERVGLPVARYFYEREHPLGDLPTCPVPDGVHLVDRDAARSEQVRTAINTAFRDHWGHADATPEMWRDQLEASTAATASPRRCSRSRCVASPPTAWTRPASASTRRTRAAPSACTSGSATGRQRARASTSSSRSRSEFLPRPGGVSHRAGRPGPRASGPGGRRGR